MIAICVIHDNPAPKGRARVTDHGAYTPPKTAAWEERVGWAYKGKPFFTGPVGLRITFYRGRKGADIDNLLKSTMDGLNGVAYGDDVQVVYVEMHKRIDRKNPRVELEIWSMEGVDEDI